MKKQAFNPYLPSYEYIPDAEPYVFGDRVYIYGSHDRFNGEQFCMNDYVCWSAPVSDLADWRYEGVIYKKTDDPTNPNGDKYLYAPDVQLGPDGRYYLYYGFDMTGTFAVAVCNEPAGKYEYLGPVKMPNGDVVGSKPGDVFMFDPGVFMDDDGRVYLYSGFAPKVDPEAVKEMMEKLQNLEDGAGVIEEAKKMSEKLMGKRMDACYVFELEQDMITVKRGPEMLAPGASMSEGTGYEGHEFFEAASMRKINGKYYFVYSSVNSHELCYATSDRPDSGFAYGGTIVSNADIYLHNDDPDVSKGYNYPGNTHGSLVNVNGQWYVFYHRQTNRHQYSRQACAEPITIEEDGSIKQVEMTSCGLNGGPLAGIGEYEARIACNLRSRDGVAMFGGQTPDEIHPYFTQDGLDRESDGNQHIANFRDGALAGFKYFDFEDVSSVSIKIRGNAQGTVFVSTEIDGDPVAQIEVGAASDVTSEWKEYKGSFNIGDGVHPLFFTFKGDGSFDFMGFELA